MIDKYMYGIIHTCKYIGVDMTVRKNFLLDEDIAKHLEDIAKKENLTQTNVIKNMIEEKYEKYSREEKLEAFKSMTLFPAGSLVGKTYKSIKEEMASRI